MLAVVSLAASAGELKPWTGGPTPPLVLKDVSGKEHRLDDYRGKVVVIISGRHGASRAARRCRRSTASSADGRHAVRDPRGGHGRGRGPGGNVPRQDARRFPGAARSRFRRVEVVESARAADDPDPRPDARIRYTAIGELDWSAPDIERRLRALQGKR